MTGKSANLGSVLTAALPGSFSAVQLRFQRHRFFGQLSRYAIISAIALTFDFSIFLGIVSTGAAASLAAAVGYSAGLVLHYILSICFVFEAARTGKSHGRLFIEFVFSGVAGLMTTVAIVTLAVETFGLSAGMAKVCAVAMSFAMTFALRRYLVFAWSRPA